MGVLGNLLDGLQKIAESETTKRIIERAVQQAEQEKAAEITRTTGKNGLRCTINSLAPLGSGAIAIGTVKNTGRSVYESVMVVAVFKDEDGFVVDKHTTYATAGDRFLPGESRPFRIFSNANDIDSVNVSIYKCVEVR